MFAMTIALCKQIPGNTTVKRICNNAGFASLHWTHELYYDAAPVCDSK